MEDRLIFRYHLDRVNPEPELLSEAPRTGSRANRSVVGNRWGDAGGYVDPGDGRPGARV
jgi:hypothetical protein